MTNDDFIDEVVDTCQIHGMTFFDLLDCLSEIGYALKKIKETEDNDE